MFKLWKYDTETHFWQIILLYINNFKNNNFYTNMFSLTCMEKRGAFTNYFEIVQNFYYASLVKYYSATWIFLLNKTNNYFRISVCMFVCEVLKNWASFSDLQLRGCLIIWWLVKGGPWNIRMLGDTKCYIIILKKIVLPSQNKVFLFLNMYLGVVLNIFEWPLWLVWGSSSATSDC